ncbi:17328_t:CDS:1 [Dentiscutata erythropus]|uniref:17328_t:CDS:1 n=1 Tax=Dentiscutata erythropus TaxID=1348616 RepID=A0A9N9AX19_9GLOM|nr:17328_t:CDS:1 [Dentiscutata erythropus]
MSYWNEIFSSFKVLSKWEHSLNNKKVYNQTRFVSVKGETFLEVKTQLDGITFLCDMKNYKHIRKHVWNVHKIEGKYYVGARINGKNVYFHRMITKFKMVGHINRESMDNRICNLQETNHRLNNLNRKLQRNNTSGINGISLFGNKWRFQWHEYGLRKSKVSKDLEELKEFKKHKDLELGNKNGYKVDYD